MALDTIDVHLVVFPQCGQVAGEQNKNLAELSDGLAPLDTGLDTSEGQEVAFPVTVGDFVRLCRDAAR